MNKRPNYNGPPRVLQTKANTAQPSQTRRLVVQTKLPVAPPVYRPQSPPKVLQTKTVNVGKQLTSQTIQPKAPAVYRPQPTPHVLQAKTVHAKKMVHSPKALQVLQKKVATIQRGGVPPVTQKRTMPSRTGVIQRAGLVAPGRGQVIQAKGKLRVVNVSTRDPDPEVVEAYRNSRYVDMKWRGVTNGTPLYSDSFANCLAIVVHNQQSDFGAMMHIFPGVVGNTAAETMLYAVDQELKKVGSLNSSGGNLELLLWKGISWTGGNHPNIRDTGASYSDYLASKHQHRFANIIDMMEKNAILPASAMLYVPKTGTVYIIHPETEGALHRYKRDTRSIADDDFVEIESKEPGYYRMRQRVKITKPEKIKDLIDQLSTAEEVELQAILRNNVGPYATEELERAAIYMLMKKRGGTPDFPTVHVYDSDVRRALLKESQSTTTTLSRSKFEKIGFHTHHIRKLAKIGNHKTRLSGYLASVPTAERKLIRDDLLKWCDKKEETPYYAPDHATMLEVIKALDQMEVLHNDHIRRLALIGDKKMELYRYLARLSPAERTVMRDDFIKWYGGKARPPQHAPDQETMYQVIAAIDLIKTMGVVNV